MVQEIVPVSTPDHHANHQPSTQEDSIMDEENEPMEQEAHAEAESPAAPEENQRRQNICSRMSPYPWW